MNAPAYTSDQLDALGELAACAVGQAGASLSRVLGAPVRLSLSEARVVSAAGVAGGVTALAREDGLRTAVRQSFFSAMRGEAIVLFGMEGGRRLSDLLGYGEVHDESIQEELLLDIGNILLGAVITGLGEQVGARFGFQAPAILAREADLPRLLEPGCLSWRRALLIEVDFAVECRDFKCHLAMLMPEDAIERMRGVLDQRLAST